MLILMWRGDVRITQGDAWDSASLFEENDVMSLISEQEWDMRR